MVLLAENWQELFLQIKWKGMRPGVALKRGTPIEGVYPLVCLPLILMFSDCSVGFYIVWKKLNHDDIQSYQNGLRFLAFCEYW
jgi:hypothetical protein